jgi:hypothetical protein
VTIDGPESAIPVIAIDGRVVGTGRPGRNTKELLEKFQALCVKDGFKVQYQGQPT